MWEGGGVSPLVVSQVVKRGDAGSPAPSAGC